MNIVSFSMSLRKHADPQKNGLRVGIRRKAKRQYIGIIIARYRLMRQQKNMIRPQNRAVLNPRQ